MTSNSFAASRIPAIASTNHSFVPSNSILPILSFAFFSHDETTMRETAAAITSRATIDSPRFPDILAILISRHLPDAKNHSHIENLFLPLFFEL